MVWEFFIIDKEEWRYRSLRSSTPRSMAVIERFLFLSMTLRILSLIPTEISCPPHSGNLFYLILVSTFASTFIDYWNAFICPPFSKSSAAKVLYSLTIGSPSTSAMTTVKESPQATSITRLFPSKNGCSYGIIFLLLSPKPRHPSAPSPQPYSCLNLSSAIMCSFPKARCTIYFYSSRAYGVEHC